MSSLSEPAAAVRGSAFQDSVLLWLVPFVLVSAVAIAASVNALGHVASSAEPAAVGTSGSQSSTAVAEDTPSPGTIREIETITGEPDGHQLVGRHVELNVLVQRLGTATTLWVGPRDNQVLVVLRHSSTASAKPALRTGEEALVRGTIQRIPEGARDLSALTERRIYIRAENVKPLS